MKTLLLTIALTFSLVTSAQVPQFAVNCADDKDGTSSKDIQDVDGNKWNYSNKKDQGPYKDGVPFTGKLIQCGKKNGKVMSKTEYSKGSKHGLAYKYHKDGWLLWKKRYSFGKEDGVQKYFHPSLNMANDGKNVTNTLKTRLSYEAENGKKEGILRAWYANGNKQYVERYTNGLLDGKQEFFDLNGKLIEEAQWSAGVHQSGCNCKHLGTLLVWSQDVLERSEGDWSYARVRSKAKGDGWDLPTIEELDVLYQNKDVIGMGNADYWSSTLVGTDGAKYMNFYNGVVNQTFMSKTYLHARPVRVLNP
jgi:hypothetical protein